MRISEQKRREDFSSIVISTLENGLTEQYGTKYAIRRSPAFEGQIWYLQPFLSVYFTRDVSREARTFISNSIRFTPVLWRKIPQFILGTLLGIKAVLSQVSSFAFASSPEIPQPETKLIIPGNHRIRIFDFSAKTCRVLLKSGFDTSTMLNEIETRKEGEKGPFINIESYDPAGHWFEETVVDGFPLPRCPPLHNYRKIETKALERLEMWLEANKKQVPMKSHLDQLIDKIQVKSDLFSRRFGPRYPAPDPEWVDAVFKQASRLPAIEITRSHGDFQPGNILCDRHDNVFITDWEHSEKRSKHYDYFVYGLAGRFHLGLSSRLEKFIKTGEIGSVKKMLPLSHSIQWRSSMAALFLLEELEWVINDCILGPYHSPTEGYLHFHEEFLSIGAAKSKIKVLFQ